MALFRAQLLVSCPEIQTLQTVEAVAHTTGPGACSWTWTWVHSYPAIRTLTNIDDKAHNSWHENSAHYWTGLREKTRSRQLFNHPILYFELTNNGQ